ncbi:Uncharacterised protein [Yersinia intermedia]|nr:Uncharacterised protein [Yersinia intermedia]CNJ78395.1 Uncharacterised protein [Yersinia intermedia]
MKRLKLSTDILMAIIITLFAICMIVYVVGDAMKGIH